MDVVVIFNGLGNQMSQYAFYLAKKHYCPSVRAVFDPRSAGEHNGFELNRIFGIDLNRSLSDRTLAWIYRKYRTRFVHRVVRRLSVTHVAEPYNYDFSYDLLCNSGKKIINYYWGGGGIVRNISKI